MNVLVVSNNSAIASQIQSYLSGKITASIESTIYTDALLTWGETNPDVVLIDLALSTHIDLFNLVATMKQPYNTVIVLAENSNRTYKRSAYEAGADDFLVKPLAREELVSKVVSTQVMPTQLTDISTFALQLSQVGTCKWDVERGTIVCSTEKAKMVGLGNASVTMDVDNYMDMIHPDDVQRVRERVQQAIDQPGSFYHVEHRFIRPDGTIIWIEARGAAVVNPSTQSLCIYGTVFNITKHKAVAQALQASNEKYRALYMGIPLATYTWEQIGDRIVLTDLNRAGAHVIDGQMILGVEADEFFKSRTDIIEDLLYCFEEQTTRQREMTYQFVTTGRTRELDVLYGFVAPNRVIVHIQDITQRKQAEEKVRKSEERYRILLELASDYAFFVRVERDNTLTIEWISGKVEYVLGYPPQEVVGDVWLSAESVVHPDDHPTLADAIQRTLNNERVSTEIQVLHKYEKPKWVRVSRLPLWDEKDQRVLGWYAAAIDITEQKEAEQTRLENERLAAKLSQEQAVAEARSQMISILSHELRTPLAVIYSNSDFVISYWSKLSDEQIRSKLESSLHYVEILNTMLDEISLLSRADRGYLELSADQVDIKALCHIILDIGKSLIEESNLRLYSEFPQSAVTIWADSKLLTHALVNLISNAVKYSPAGGNIYFTLSAHKHAIQIQVSDQGIGIPRDVLPQIFEPFFRAYNTEGISGTGIGLSIVKKIIDLHGGTIDCDSEVGVGTTFTIYLPVQAALP